MDTRHGIEAAFSTFEQAFTSCWIQFQDPAFHAKHGCDELQVISDAVLQFFEEGGRAIPLERQLVDRSIESLNDVELNGAGERKKRPSQIAIRPVEGGGCRWREKPKPSGDGAKQDHDHADPKSTHQR